MSLTHKELCAVAVRWLKRASSQGGHGCHVALSEVRTGLNGEIPDAIGFRQAGFGARDGSVLVEVKTSRSDFLADKKKPHRTSGGVGKFRYFMAPEGLIKVEELPEKWGLVEVNSRGHCKVLAGPAAQSWKLYCDDYLAGHMFDCDHEREQFMLVKMLHRVGDVEKLNKNLKEAWGERNRLADQVNRLRKELQEAKQKNLHRYALEAEE